MCIHPNRDRGAPASLHLTAAEIRRRRSASFQHKNSAAIGAATVAALDGAAAANGKSGGCKKATDGKGIGCKVRDAAKNGLSSEVSHGKGNGSGIGVDSRGTCNRTATDGSKASGEGGGGDGEGRARELGAYRPISSSNPPDGPPPPLPPSEHCLHLHIMRFCSASDGLSPPSV